jgi:pilus assembly protein TadC
MKIFDKQQIKSLSKTFRYTLKDRRKLISLLIVLALPVILFMWRFIPEGIEFPFYGELNVFVWTFNLYFAQVMLSAAWFLSTPRRDFATQIIVLAALFFSVFLTWNALPIFDESPWWLDVLISLVLFTVVSVYLFYVYRNYINRNVDYKQLHDGIVHDLHHQRFLNSISRIEGLMKVAEMEEPYKSMCEDEIAELKESITYVADKYKALY